MAGFEGFEDRHKEVFREEARELLSELEGSLLELEEDPENTELIERIFRAMHTIKGSGAMAGFDEIVSFTHELETAFDLVRDKKVPVTKELIGITLTSRDILRDMLEGTAGSSAGQAAQEIISNLKHIIPEFPCSGSKKVQPHGINEKALCLPGEEKALTYRIRFRPNQDIFKIGTNPSFLIDELRALGDCMVIAQIDSIPVLSEFDFEACYLYWDFILTTSHGVNAIKDVFIFVENSSELKIEVIDDGLSQSPDYKKIGEILLEKGDVSAEDLRKALRQRRNIGSIMVESGLVEQGKLTSALAEQQYIREKRKQFKEAEAAASVRVPSRKLDVLADLVGELVTLQARLNQFSLTENDSELVAIAEGVERLTDDLRENIMSVRLIPISTVFSKLKRVVRDLSSELGKEIELEIEGGETELDKSLIEKISDPLMHIIRNSIDHGVEPPAGREALGKPRKGTIILHVFHSGASVLIQVRDDGKGLDAEAIRTKAIDKGLIPPGVEIEGKDIYQLIFASGLSTANEVTKISGRGVGMDVVRKNIDALRGTVEVESWKGKGTCVTIRVPLTLAIIDGLLVKIADDHFVIPLSIVEECVELTRSETVGTNSRHIANVRGEIIPYIDLRDIFGIGGTPPEIEQIVITQTDGRKVGFLVDSVVGETQTVIKALGSTFKKVDWISGATILGDGTVALIIAASHIMKLWEEQGAQRTACKAE